MLRRGMGNQAMNLQTATHKKLEERLGKLEKKTTITLLIKATLIDIKDIISKKTGGHYPEETEREETGMRGRGTMKERELGLIGAQEEEDVALRVPIDLEQEVGVLQSITSTEKTETDPTEDKVQELVRLRGTLVQ